MYIPATLGTAAECATWPEAAHAAQFLTNFLWDNAHQATHVYIHRHPDDSYDRDLWGVWVDRQPVKTCGQCGAPHGTCSHTRPIPTSGTAVA